MVMTCEFRFGAPSWGTGGPEFKSRRSDQKFINKSKTLGPVTRFRRKGEITNKSGIKERNKTKTTAETTAVLGAKQQRTNIEGHTLAMAKRPPEAKPSARWDIYYAAQDPVEAK